MRGMIARLAALAVSILVLAGCGDDAVQPAPGAVGQARQEIAAAPARQARPVDPAAAEAALGRIEQRIRPAAEQVCREQGASRCRWDVRFEPSPVFNAYASGRDDIVVLGGVFSLARSEAEVAMVLAHEKAHHILDHVAEANRNAGWGAMLADLLVTVGATSLAEAIGLPLPQAVLDGLRRTAAGAGAQAGVLAFSVENEKEADALAAEILHRAGYDLGEARGMIVAMGTLGQGDGTPRLLRTHPAGPERLAHWDAVTAKLATGG
jgi:predicted Zn-dependent protease